MAIDSGLIVTGRGMGGTDMTAKDKSGQTILIIDDSQDDIDVLEQLLRQNPRIDQIEKVATESDGLRVFEALRPDCVLLDFSLPGHDGLNFLTRIKSFDAYAAVVMMTGEGSEELAVAAMKAGASDYVIKDRTSAVGLGHAVNNAIDKMRLQRKIDAQQKEQELFLRTLLHDARAPLRHISTFSELLVADVSAGEYADMAEYCGDIRTAAKRIEDLLDTLASYALSESSVSFDRICLDDVIKAVLDNLAHRIEAKQVVIHHDALPMVTGHHPQLIQLLQNLVGNSIKYCQADKPEINISVCTFEDGVNHLFKVQDNGIGIPEDKLTYIFQPFKRLWSQDIYEGTGLGLAICQKIVMRHGGKIWCESEEGKGSTFCFTLQNADVARGDERLAS